MSRRRQLVASALSPTKLFRWVLMGALVRTTVSNRVLRIRVLMWMTPSSLLCTLLNRWPCARLNLLLSFTLLT